MYILMELDQKLQSGDQKVDSGITVNTRRTLCIIDKKGVSKTTLKKREEDLQFGATRPSFKSNTSESLVASVFVRQRCHLVSSTATSFLTQYILLLGPCPLLLTLKRLTLSETDFLTSLQLFDSFFILFRK